MAALRPYYIHFYTIILLKSIDYLDPRTAYKEKVSTGEKKEEYASLLDLLTPVVKIYPSYMKGINKASLTAHYYLTISNAT